MYSDRIVFLSSILFPVLFVAAGWYALAFWSFSIMFSLSSVGYVLRRQMIGIKRLEEERWGSPINDCLEAVKKCPEQEAEGVGRVIAKYGNVDIYGKVSMNGSLFSFAGVVVPKDLAKARLESEMSPGQFLLLFDCLKYVPDVKDET